MIGWVDVYKVVEAMVPLYFALILGYGSVKWWRIFKADQCDVINRLACYFALPLFTFQFTSQADPLQMNYRFLAADAISKVIVLLVLAAWCAASTSSTNNGTSNSKGSYFNSFCYCWSITIFSMCAMTNTLVVGVPLMKAMYGQWAVDLIVQMSVSQFIFWFTSMLFVLELRRVNTELEKDLEGNAEIDGVQSSLSSFRRSMKIVCLKLVTDSKFCACLLGLFWALLSNRFHLKLPGIVEGSVLIMSRAGTGIAMFSMGLFMACQEKFIACGASLSLFGMVLKFVVGPATMAIGALVVGLRGDILRVAIIQAALPQSITTFVFAKEYGLHANVLSTAVIFGTLVSLPVMIAYYTVIESFH